MLFTILSEEKFLMEEITILADTKAIELANFFPKCAFQTVLQNKVDAISNTPIQFVEEVWSYIESVVVTGITFHSEAYPHLNNSARRASQNLIQKMREMSVGRVKEIVDMERFTDYTCDPEYMVKWIALMTQQASFKSVVTNWHREVAISGYGEVEVTHLREHISLVEQAFDIRMRLTAYWEIVTKRLVDNLAMRIVYNVRNLVENEMLDRIIDEVMNQDEGGIERLLKESPSVASKRDKLTMSIKLLKESEAVMTKITDQIAAYDGDCAADYN